MLYTILKARLAQQVLLRYSPSPHIDKMLSLSRKVDFHFYFWGHSWACLNTYFNRPLVDNIGGCLPSCRLFIASVMCLIISRLADPAAIGRGVYLSYYNQRLFARGFEGRISALNLARRNISSFACNSKYSSVFKIDRLNFIYPSSKFVLLLVVVRMMQYKYLLRICTQSLFRKKFDSNLQIGIYIIHTRSF